MLHYLVGIDLFGLIRLKQRLINTSIDMVILSGLICLDWYDWNMPPLLHQGTLSYESGLICLDWYDWNIVATPFRFVTERTRRDWSVWIDTIETYLHNNVTNHTNHSRDWSVWIDTIETLVTVASVPAKNPTVGIDLFGLIRLKPRLISAVFEEFTTCRDWSVWIDTIETMHWLKLLKNSIFSRRDWSVWIDTIETLVNHTNPIQCRLVGIDLFGLIRLKPCKRILQSYQRFLCRDWSVWIDTIETNFCPKSGKFLNLSGLICLDWYDWN